MWGVWVLRASYARNLGSPSGRNGSSDKKGYLILVMGTSRNGIPTLEKPPYPAFDPKLHPDPYLDPPM